MPFDLDNDRQEQDNLIADPSHTRVYRRLDAALTLELMRSMSFAMHDRMPSPESMSQDEEMSREGWTWRFPVPADTTQGQEFYL
jgi:hypothetical protein